MVELSLTDAFRTRLAAQLERSSEEMVDAVSSAMFADLGPYQQLAGPGEVDRLRADIRRVLQAFRRLVAGEDPFTGLELSELHRTGGRRAQQGIPLDAVTEGIEIALRVTWRFVRDIAQELTTPSGDDEICEDPAAAAASVADLAVETREFMHELSGVVVTGYRMEREHGVAGRALATADLVDEMLESRWENTRRLRQSGRALGYEIVEPLALLVVAATDPASAPDDGLLADLVTHLPQAMTSHVRYTPCPHVAVIVPYDEAADVSGVKATLDGTDLPRRGLVMVDEQPRSLLALPGAYRALATDIPAARVMANGAGVVSPHQTDLLRLLRGLPLASRVDFVRRALGPVLDLPPSKSAEVVNTLHAYFRGRGRLDEAAADLRLHRNSFRYRLDRAQSMLGVSFRDGAGRLKVEVALVLHELARYESMLLDQPPEGPRTDLQG